MSGSPQDREAPSTVMVLILKWVLCSQKGRVKPQAQPAVSQGRTGASCIGLALNCRHLSAPGLIFAEISALKWLWSVGQIGHHMGSSYRYKINK